MWEDKPHIDIVNWLKSREGAVLRDAMPHYFKVGDDFDYNDLLAGFRQEVNALVPNHPDFAAVRKQIAVNTSNIPLLLYEVFFNINLNFFF